MNKIFLLAICIFVFGACANNTNGDDNGADPASGSGYGAAPAGTPTEADTISTKDNTIANDSGRRTPAQRQGTSDTINDQRQHKQDLQGQ